MTIVEARDLIATLAAAYPRQPIEQATIDVYVAHFKPLAQNSAANALKTVISEHRTFPPIAVILDAYQRAALLHAEEAERERRQREDEQLSSGEPVPLKNILKTLPKASRSWVDVALNQGDIGLETVQDGECEDCQHQGVRYKLGVFSVCRKCAERRQRAGGLLADAPG